MILHTTYIAVKITLFGSKDANSSSGKVCVRFITLTEKLVDEKLFTARNLNAFI